MTDFGNLLCLGGLNPFCVSTCQAQTRPKKNTDDFEVKSYPSLKIAMECILTPDIKVVGFGEVHKLKYSNIPSTLDHIADDIVPILSKLGFTDLILEHLPTSSPAEDEANDYHRTHKFGPALRDHYASDKDYCGIIKTFDKARSQGLWLRGCHAGSIEEQINNYYHLGRYINERIMEKGERILNKNGKFAFVAGMLHNNIEPVKDEYEKNSSIGNIFRQKLGKGYMEIDIFVPEFAKRVEKKWLSLDTWDRYIPKQGVKVLNFGNGRYAVILPWFPHPINYSPLHPRPKCKP